MTQSYIHVDSGTMHRCDNCDYECDDTELDMITDLEQRLDPGGTVPSGQCPKCQALMYELEEDDEEEESDVPELHINMPSVQEALVTHKEYYGGGSGAELAAFTQAGEELAELIVAMNHFRRGRATADDVMEEVADVLLMCRLLVYLFEDEEYVQDTLIEKARRFTANCGN